MPNNAQKLVLVTGATGKQGGAVFRHLRKRNFSVRVLTRDVNKPEARALVGKGVDVIQGDQNDPASLTRALENVYGVYSVQNSIEGAEPEIRQGFNVADAANRSGVRHLVYSSVGSADKNTGIPHFDSKFQIEEHIRATGLRYTIFRPVFFMENWLAQKESINQGKLAQPLEPATRLQMIAVDDIGAAVALAFEHPGRWENRSVDLAGDELSMTELAQAFSARTGMSVQYIQVPWNEFGQHVPLEISTMYRWFESTGYHVNIVSLRNEIPNLTSFERWLNSNWQAPPADRKSATA